MPGIAKTVGTPKFAMLRSPGNDTLASGSASGTQRFRVTKHFTRPNIENFTGSIAGMGGGWSYSLTTIKAGFFDRGAILNRLTDIQAKVYGKFGAYVRRRARTSMGSPTKNISLPGRPPKPHTRDLKDKIFFYWNFYTRSVVIGPLFFRTAHQAEYNMRSLNGFSTVPALLEYGGTAVYRKKNKTMKYLPRPYMGPAFWHVYNKDLGRFWREQRQTPFTP